MGVFWLAENRLLQLILQCTAICIWLRRNFDVKCATFRNHVLGHRKPCASLLDSVTQSRMCGSCYRETDCSSFRVIPGWEELPHGAGFGNHPLWSEKKPRPMTHTHVGLHVQRVTPFESVCYDLFLFAEKYHRCPTVFKWKIRQINGTPGFFDVIIIQSCCWFWTIDLRIRQIKKNTTAFIDWFS